MTVKIDIGVDSSGAPALVDLEELLATRLLVQGNSGSGKSHLLRRLLEESPAHQEIRRFGSDILGELGEALGGDHAGEAALPPPAHEVGHRAQ